MGKKIGLAVCYDTKNFGSQLQVLATIKKLEEFGYNTEIIRYRKKITPKFVIQTIPRLFNITFIKEKLAVRKTRIQFRCHPFIYKKICIRDEKFEGFIKEYFPNISEPYAGWENLVKRSNQNYDIFLCGSDQLWLPQNLGSHFYTLEFAANTKMKIAYATSFGVERIPVYQRRNTAKYLKRFQALSTREIAGQKIVENVIGKHIRVVCDPTLLFDSEGWKKIIPNRRMIKEPYIFCYFLGTNRENRKAAEVLQKKTGLKIVSCPFLDHFVPFDLKFGDVQMFDVDSCGFLNLIRHAEFILTDSLHGSVFSVLHHKKFIVFNRYSGDRNSRNGRIDSLCTFLGLNNRRYSGDIMAVSREINYCDVEKRLIAWRTESIHYLRSALESGRVRSENNG